MTEAQNGDTDAAVAAAVDNNDKEDTNLGGGGEASGTSPERRAEFNREMSPWTPENSYRHHLINDILRCHDEREGNTKVRTGQGRGKFEITVPRFQITFSSFQITGPRFPINGSQFK